MEDMQSLLLELEQDRVLDLTTHFTPQLESNHVSNQPIPPLFLFDNVEQIVQFYRTTCRTKSRKPTSITRPTTNLLVAPVPPTPVLLGLGDSRG